MPISDAEFVAFDLETTGLHPASSQILELGAVRFRGDGEVLGQFEQLIDPECRIPPVVSCLPFQLIWSVYKDLELTE